MSIEAVEKNIQAADLLYPYIDLVIPQDPITKDTVPLRTHSGNISVRPKNLSYSNKEGMPKLFLIMHLPFNALKSWVEKFSRKNSLVLRFNGKRVICSKHCKP